MIRVLNKFTRIMKRIFYWGKSMLLAIKKNIKETVGEKTIPQMEPWFDEAEGLALYYYMKNNRYDFSANSELEKRLADYTGAAYATLSVNGTFTLTLALLALDLKPGDEVLVPAFTMIATPNSCLLVGIKPVLVDIEPQTLCMDMEKAAKSITPKTKAMIYVPLNGRSGNMDSVVKFAKDHNLFLIEDAAQALGSYWQGKHLGTFGDIGSFSFSIPKIITTGQGGALITDNKAFHEKISLLKNFGQTSQQDIHDYIGWNFKFSNILAVVGIEQFKKLPWRVKRRKEIFKRYYENLRHIPEIEFIKTDPESTTLWCIDIFVPEPEKLADFLKKQNINTRLCYPAINTQKIYRQEYTGKSFPIAEHYSSRGLWLPSATQLSDKEIDYITGNIKEFYSSK